MTEHFAINTPLDQPNAELVSALAHIPVGNALLLGEGEGVNSRYLQQQGFSVTLWQHRLEGEQAKPPAPLSPGIQVESYDLNRHRFNGDYQLIVSLGAMMFLQPESIPQLIADMQAATRKHGFNLIIAPLVDPQLPAAEDLAFQFRSGELSHFYRRWHIISYHQQPGSLRWAAKDEPSEMAFATLLAQKAALKSG